jgi:hypothetical protein
MMYLVFIFQLIDGAKIKILESFLKSYLFL